MIQAPLPKPIEMPKARPAAETSNKPAVSDKSSAPRAKALKEENAARAKEFSKELETSMSTDTEVQPVKVSDEQALELPSSFLAPAAGTVETTSPKVFDPALTKDVESLIQPKTTDAAAVKLTDEELLALAAAPAAAEAQEISPEILQAMLKTPQLAADKAGRSPAIELSQAEVDPQLLGNEDFVAHKNIFAKKSAQNPYGMKTAPMQHQSALENNLKQTQTVGEVSAAPETSPMNSQQFILGIQSDFKSAQPAEAQAPMKVFDMSNVKSSNPNEIMSQITDYVVQARAAKEPTVNMRVKHDELGMIDITVSKLGANQEMIAVNIGAHSADGKNFFQQNSRDLVSHLTTAGLNISEFKVDTPSQTAKNDFDFGSQQGRNNQPGSEKQFGSEQNQRRHESERRQDLWKLLNKEAA